MNFKNPLEFKFSALKSGKFCTNRDLRAENLGFCTDLN